MYIGDRCISKMIGTQNIVLCDLKEEKEYHDKWVAPLFNKKVEYKEHPKVGIYGFYIFNKELVNFFKKLGINHGIKIKISIPKKIMKNKRLSLRFLRGLFDTDGNIYFDRNRSAKNPINNRPVIKLGTVSKNLSEQVFELLRISKLHPYMKKPYKGKRDKNYLYTVVIYRVSDIEYFIRNIGFKNPKHYTKWQIFKKYGYCIPRTTVQERTAILKGKKVYK